MKRTYFHGTSSTNAKKILKQGFNRNAEKLWSPSENGTYFWSPEELEKHGHCSEGDGRNYALRMAYDSAQVAFAVSNASRCVVLEVELDESEVQDDLSCPNMDGAVVCFREIKAEEIKAVHVSPDLSLMRGYFLGIVYARELFARELTEMEEKIARLFAKAEIYFEQDDYALEPISKTKALRLT